ncbi:hypothetical protein BKA65DRAFT_38001 [Rhexocercosporidium sp. MPI-PUGE-AT-0058]|nr:hypothetical protein BKA65DRAFT_38001 [Rhexocercosporidium sp. MPI-PUGE-AT-0058]
MVAHAGVVQVRLILFTDHEIGRPISLRPNFFFHGSLVAQHGRLCKVAQLMAGQEEFSILRRFGVLNMQKLLYLHAEIIHLEAELKELSKRDASHGERQFHAKDW